MKNDINEGIICNVKNCVYNEKGANCNLERVTISKGDGEHHYCKSFLPLNDEDEKQESANSNVESSDEYFDFNDLISDITVDISSSEEDNKQK